MNLFVKIKNKEALPEIRDTKVFRDTNNDSVQLAYSLGIVKGADGAFLPYAEITRQEAAVMLTRLAVQLGLSGEDSKALFNDDNNIAPWAKESVYTLTIRK